MSLADENVRCRHATSVSLSELKFGDSGKGRVSFALILSANLLPSEENHLPENQTADFLRLLDSRFVDIASTPPTGVAPP